MRLVVVSAAMAALAILPGCKASVSAEANTGQKEVADFDKPMEQPVAAEPPSAGSGDTALLGARQDLAYKGPPTQLCKCLAVALGQPQDAAFQWTGERPKTDPSTELVVALSSGGITCAEAGPKTKGASYWGYEVTGNDVVVVVENAAAGRPVASGAIIPRPLGNGQVFVRPAGKKIPYGRPASGGGARCQIGQLPPAPVPSAAPASASMPASTAAPAGQVRIRADEPSPMSPQTTIP